MVDISCIKKNFSGTNVLNGISVHIAPRNIVSIIGPSGCGKSTLLNIISGIIKADSGSIRVNPDLRLCYTMQSDLLLPWRTLRHNLTLGLEIYGLNHKSHADILDKYLLSFDIKDYENYYPSALSGGMKQRAALIRSLVCQPDILLLDEPFANLDYDIKIKIQREILKYFSETNMTVILVTHDIEDAIALSDKIIIMSEKPSIITKVFDSIDLNISKRDPIEARKSPLFRDYFIKILDEMKYIRE